MVSGPPAMPPSPPSAAREQQLALWALSAWGGVESVLLSSAPPALRDAATDVLNARHALVHLESPLSLPSSPADRLRRSAAVSPPSVNYQGTNLFNTAHSTTTTNRSSNSNSNSCSYSNGGSTAIGSSYRQGNSDGDREGVHPRVTPPHQEPPEEALAALIDSARNAMHALHELDARRAGPDAYATVMEVLGSVAAASSPQAVCEVGSQPAVHDILPMFPSMAPLAKPTVVIGLNPLNIAVSVGNHATLVQPGVKAALYVASIPTLQTSLCKSPSAPWFPWMFACLSPFDSGLGAAHINVQLAMRAGLALALKLNTAALEADPANSMPLPSLWRRAYSIYGAGSTWRLVVMVVDERGKFTTSEIWCGSGTLVSDMLQFLALLSHIASEAEARCMYVSNWLYSLRSTVPHSALFQPSPSSVKATPPTAPMSALQTPIQLASAATPLPLQPLHSVQSSAPVPTVHRRERRSLDEGSGISAHPLGTPLSPISPVPSHSHSRSHAHAHAHSQPLSHSSHLVLNGYAHTHTPLNTHSEHPLGTNSSRSNFRPVLQPPSPSAWLSPTRHVRRASTGVLMDSPDGHGHSHVVSPIPEYRAAYPNALLSPFPRLLPRRDTYPTLHSAAERSWSAMGGARRGSSRGSSCATSPAEFLPANSTSSTLSDLDFGDENGDLALRRFSRE